MFSRNLNISGDYVYWTDWQMRTIQRADKTTGKKRLIILDQMPDLMGLKAVESVTNGLYHIFTCHP